MDGPYSQGYVYDQWGNMTQRYGWGGEVQGSSAGQTSYINYYYQTSSGGPNNGQYNNQRSGFGYDPAGNLTWDGGQTFQYDVTGQQTSASYGGYSLSQNYDGDGLRVSKNDNGGVEYYLRSTVLGGQVISELSSSGGWNRGYVYGGGGLLAILQNGTIYWNHEDPITKSKRITDSSGNVYSTVETDPWGANTARSGSEWFQPHRYTTYERDGNGSDEAMLRRYNRWHSRFDQPDPFDGSYDSSDPQSFNRYAYTQNDPANFVDPTGLDDYGLGPPPPVPTLVPPRGPLDVITINNSDRWGLDHSILGDNGMFLIVEIAGNEVITGGVGPQNSLDSGPQGWNNLRWTKCPPVQFKITGIGPNQAPGTTAISQTARADIRDGGVAIKSGNFGVKGVNGNNRPVFLNMKFEVDWGTANPAGAPSGIPTQGPFVPVDNIGPASVRNSPGNQIDVYNYQKYDDALASTRTAMVTTWIPENTAGVKCPE
jgi:RHS repeat-associated protein